MKNTDESLDGPVHIEAQLTASLAETAELGEYFSPGGFQGSK